MLALMGAIQCCNMFEGTGVVEAFKDLVDKRPPNQMLVIETLVIEASVIGALLGADSMYSDEQRRARGLLKVPSHGGEGNFGALLNNGLAQQFSNHGYAL